ncbi:MAG: polyphosphate polymerase domain-containing protein [Bacteroidales bacterium]|nr:polyphosphate polymerase domain-containing protein [Bacteroidales bacterium]
MKELLKIIAGYDGITLQEMDSVSLLNRMDFKYVFSNLLLPEILERIKPDYRILTIGKDREFSYLSLYYDTPDNKLYLDHHNGKVNRYKVRFRAYQESNLYFLEIKYKTKNGRTIKKRIKTPKLETRLTEESKKFIYENSPMAPESLEPKVYTSFNRLTLVNNKLTERITIDYNLYFENGHVHKDLPKLAIAEVKKDNSNGNDSCISQVLDEMGIPPRGLSKYCIGRVLTDDSVKYNRFKESLLIFDKISNHNDFS